MSRSWDHPNSDPLGDLHEFVARGREALRRPEVGGPLIVPPRAAKIIEQRLGRPLTVEDIPPGVPGIWTSIVVADDRVDYRPLVVR